MVIFLLTVNYLKNNKSILSLKALARCPAVLYFLFKDKEKREKKTKTTQQAIALHRVAESISLGIDCTVLQILRINSNSNSPYESTVCRQKPKFMINVVTITKP